MNTLKQRILKASSLAQLDLLRVDIMKDVDNFKENQQLFIKQKAILSKTNSNSELNVSDFLYVTYDTNVTRRNNGTGKLMILGRKTVNNKYVNFLGVDWNINDVEFDPTDFKDDSLYEKKSWTIGNNKIKYWRYTMLNPNHIALGIDWREYFITKFKNEYYLFQKEKSYYLVRNDIDVETAYRKGTKMKDNKDFNYILKLNKDTFNSLKEFDVPLKERKIDNFDFSF